MTVGLVARSVEKYLLHHVIFIYCVIYFCKTLNVESHCIQTGLPFIVVVLAFFCQTISVQKQQISSKKAHQYNAHSQLSLLNFQPLPTNAPEEFNADSYCGALTRMSKICYYHHVQENSYLLQRPGKSTQT